MAKQRIVDTRFWDDSYIVSLKPIEKLVFLYLLTNPLTNIAGVYELSSQRAAFDIGLQIQKIEACFRRFEQDGKIMSTCDRVGIKNFLKYQSSRSPKIYQGILTELRKAPQALLEQMDINYKKLEEGIVMMGTVVLKTPPASHGDTKKLQKELEDIAIEWRVR